MNDLQSTSEHGVSIRMLAEGKKVIPIYFKNGDLWHSDVKLPDLVIANHTTGTAVIKGVQVSGSAGGKKVVAFTQDDGQISTVVAETNVLLNRLIRKPANQWRQYNLHVLFGDVPPENDTYGETNHLEPSSVTCLRLQDLILFHFVGNNTVDQILCQIKIELGGVERIIEYPIPLTPYFCKGDYIFPVRGSATVVGTPWNRVMGHRMATSQEFAVDIADYRRLENGELSLSSPPDSDKVADYFAFEREILAVGDGVVAAAGNQWPNKWVENPLEYSETRVVELTVKLLEDGVDFNHAILGNYVVIDHRNGEFSLYAHMSEDTLTVEVGDRVRQGQIIGRIGNTSNSDSPHLHFHLMDSANFQLANGLPVMFKNLPAATAPIYDFEGSNSLLYSDYIFIHT